MPPRRPSPIGAHIPVAGGLARTGLPYLRSVGAEAVQLFASNPRGWAPSDGDPDQDAAFRDGCSATGVALFIHAPYLVNFGSPSAATLARSVDATRHALRRGADLGARGVVVHAGSAVTGGTYDTAMHQVREHLRPLLDEIDDDGPRLLIEPTAGGGEALAGTAEALGPYLAALDHHPRAGLCLDTCHLLAAGHDVAAPGGMRRTVDAVVKAVGRGRIGLVHANDSKDPLGSTRDRHETLGKGTIGEEPFAELFRHPALAGVAIVVETPGKIEDHRRDVELLKSLRTR